MIAARTIIVPWTMGPIGPALALVGWWAMARTLRAAAAIIAEPAVRSPFARSTCPSLAVPPKPCTLTGGLNSRRREFADEAGSLSGRKRMKSGEDSRVKRTRAALIGAFDHLLLSRRRTPIRVAEIVAEAEVGRSTFYEHYRGADDIHLAALERPFAILADAAAGDGDEIGLAALLAHFWENRQRARESFMGRMHDKVTRLLAGMVEQRLGEPELAIPRRLAALQLAEAALAPLRGWVTAEAPCTPQALAASLCRSGRALRAALAART